MPIILASGSATRNAMLTAAGVAFDVVLPRVDEAALHDALRDDGASPRDMADHLAEAKAAKVSARHPEALVIGADQTLEIDGTVLTKPEGRAATAAQLARLAGHHHDLHSAAVACMDGRPIWRHVATARLHMRSLSDEAIRRHVDATWPDAQGCLGGYRLEGPGARLFTRIEGCHFTVLGLPLLPLLSWLIERGTLAP